MTSQLLDQLTKFLGKNAVLTGDSVVERNPKAGLSNSSTGLPTAILLPRTTEEVSSILRWCNEHNQAVVPQGGMTGLVKGTTTKLGEYALSLERMRNIEEVDQTNRTMTLQAGVPLQAAQEAAEEYDLMLPLDLGARGSANIGGTIATNAGGNRVIRYGMMRDMVLGLEVVLADGSIVSSMGKMIKNNAGYDLKQLFIGSEGTLGVATRAVLRLRKAPKSQNTALAALNNFDNVKRFLSDIDGKLGGSLSAFEVMWQDFYKLVTTPPAQNTAPIPDTFPFYVLVESLGADQKADAEKFETILIQALENGLLTDAVIAKNQAERDAMWAIREDVSQSLQFRPIFGYDVSMDLQDMEAYVCEVKSQLNDRWPDSKHFFYGHLGDGNLHIVVAVGDKSKETYQSINEVVYGPLKKGQSSISAEHGIGIDKRSYLPFTRSDAEINLMKKLKSTLDPNGILNPGKIFET